MLEGDLSKVTSVSEIPTLLGEFWVQIESCDLDAALSDEIADLRLKTTDAMYRGDWGIAMSYTCEALLRLEDAHGDS